MPDPSTPVYTPEGRTDLLIYGTNTIDKKEFHRRLTNCGSLLTTPHGIITGNERYGTSLLARQYAFDNNIPCWSVEVNTESLSTRRKSIDPLLRYASSVCIVLGVKPDPMHQELLEQARKLARTKEDGMPLLSYHNIRKIQLSDEPPPWEKKADDTAKPADPKKKPGKRVIKETGSPSHKLDLLWTKKAKTR